MCVWCSALAFAVVASAPALRWGEASSVELLSVHCVDCVSRWLLCTVVLLQSLLRAVELMLTVLVEVE